MRYLLALAFPLLLASAEAPVLVSARIRGSVVIEAAGGWNDVEALRVTYLHVNPADTTILLDSLIVALEPDYWVQVHGPTGLLAQK